MFINSRLGLFLLVPFLCTPQISARQEHSLTFPGDDEIHLDVAVSAKSGMPVSGLQQQDFTILDNNVPQTITSFEAVDGRQAHIEVILVLDAMNIGSRKAAITFEEIRRFLKSEGGLLAYPTAVAILTEKELRFQEDFSTNGNAISAELSEIWKRSPPALPRSASRFQAFAELLARERDRPGRKLMIWVSPGWPPLAGLENTRDAKLREQVFGNIVEVSAQLWEGQITVYSVDPSATSDTEPGLTDPPTSHLRPPDREVYVAGAYKPSDVGPGDLALETIATQSGGSALHPGNDIASALRKCVADADAYYELSFDPPISDRPNEYQRLEVHVAKPGLTARTRQGYYSQPPRAENFTAGSEQPGKAGGDNNPPGAAPADASRAVYTNAHPYLDWPLAQLTEHIPELQAIQPAPDQQELSMILQKMGRTVDGFVRDIGDLIAHEDVTQERLNAAGKIKTKERVQDNYLILHHGYEWGATAEYRMDDNGNHLGAIGLEKGYLVTSGYALSCISFSTVAQSQLKFRYLGEEKIGSRETYVLGFAQKPGEVTFTTVMRGTGGTEADMLTQGILWWTRIIYKLSKCGLIYSRRVAKFSSTS